MKLLVLSSTASSINYQLALADHPGVELFVSDASPYAGGLYNSGITPFVVPRARHLSPYRAALDHLIAEHKIDALVPTSDHDLEGVMELLQLGWKPSVAMFQPRYDVYRTMSDKSRLIEALVGLGVELPIIYKQPSDAIFPCVVKPTREGGSKGVKICENRHELDTHCDHLRRTFGNDFLIQEYIPGGLGSIHVVLQLYDLDGKLCGEAASHSHQTFMTWGGGGNAGAIVHEPGLLAQARKIVSLLGGWVGPINLEFKRHAENHRFYLFEVNCRLNGYSYLFTMNGLNFPAAIVDLLRGNQPKFLSFSPESQACNFIVGFQEQPVEYWLHEKS